MEMDLSKVLRHVEVYFKEHLPHYSILTVSKKNRHPDDYLYVVSAKNEKDGTFAVWSCWNESIQSLNHGHYSIKTLEACERIAQEFIDTTIYYEVYKYSHNVKKRIIVTDSEEQARKFCEDNGWELKDENDFLWSLDYREA